MSRRENERIRRWRFVRCIEKRAGERNIMPIADDGLASREEIK